MGIIDTARKAAEYDKLDAAARDRQVSAAMAEAQAAKEGLAGLIAQKDAASKGMYELLNSVDNDTFNKLASNPTTHKLVGTDNVATIADGRAINEILKRIG